METMTWPRYFAISAWGCILAVLFGRHLTDFMFLIFLPFLGIPILLFDLQDRTKENPIDPALACGILFIGGFVTVIYCIPLAIVVVLLKKVFA